MSIVRPKGYIIAGTRNQLTSTEMLDDFRILSEALKNIDVLLYDDLLNNLEAWLPLNNYFKASLRFICR